MAKNTSKVVAALRGLESNLKKILREVEKPGFGAARAATGSPTSDRDPVRDSLAAASSGKRWTPERIERELARQAAEAPRVPDAPEVTAYAGGDPRKLELARQVAGEHAALLAHSQGRDAIPLRDMLRVRVPMLAARAALPVATTLQAHVLRNLADGRPLLEGAERFRTA